MGAYAVTKQQSGRGTAGKLLSPGGACYDWNARRKLWHGAGCLLMVAIFYLWKDVTWPMSGGNMLVCFAWAEAALALGIDVVRFQSPRQHRALKRLPFYGKLMRPIEGNHFNATTYCSLAGAILITAWRLGWCAEATVVFSLAVLAISDPAASWTRHQLEKRGWGREKALGFLTFFASSFLVMCGINWWLGSGVAPGALLFIGFIVALVESYTAHGVALVRPLTTYFHSRIARRTAFWLSRFYPDDNLLIPLTVAFLASILPQFTW
jgi:dolichol kinase